MQTPYDDLGYTITISLLCSMEWQDTINKDIKMYVHMKTA